jgi:enoyl-CoA hydratase/carnithine racemase
VHLLVTREGTIAVVTLNRPARRNALSSALLKELKQTFAELGDDRDVRVVILAATGSVFCSGHDLKEMTGRREEEYEELFATCTDVRLGMQSIPQPVIAEVQGMATAAGCQLVAACDLGIAAETAEFATPGVKIGLFCSTPAVPIVRCIGRKRALEMLLTGAPISAHTAAEWGLINRVVPTAELQQATRSLALQISQANAYTLCVGKHAFYEQLNFGEMEAYQHAQQAMISNAQAPAAQEGIRRFLKK